MASDAGEVPLLHHLGRCLLFGLLAGIFLANAHVASAQASGIWQAQDIGSVAAAGHSSGSGGTFTVAGSGADIWGASDAFQFYAQQLTGDGTIVARVVSIDDTSGWAKAGVMMRESLDPAARNVFLPATPEWHGIVAQARSNPGAATGGGQSVAASVPYWLRLDRSGNAITVSTSLDGVTWAMLSTYNPFPMAATIYVGLAVTSHNNGTLCNAAFDHVSITTPPTGSSTANAPVIASLSPGTAVSGGATTTNSAFTFAGAADPGAAVELWLNSSTNSTSPLDGWMTTVTADSTGAWSAPVSGFMPGAYGFNAHVRNTSSSNNPASPTFTVTVQSPAGGGTWLSVGFNSSGQTSFQGSTISVANAGADIWDTSDAFQFFAQQVTGDGMITARVVSLDNTSAWAKAGVMIREQLNSSSTNVFACVTPAWNGIVAQNRSTADGTTASAPGPAANAPYWLRLARSGNMFTAAASPDGAVWTTYATFTVAMGSSAYFGLAVTSHDNATTGTAVFDHVALAADPPPATAPSAPSNLTANFWSNTQLELVWSDNSSDETGFEVERATASAGPFALVASLPANTRRLVDGGLIAGTTYYYRARAINTAGASAYSNTVSKSVQFSNGPTPAATLAATAASPTSITLSWTQGSGQFTWIMERSTDGVAFAEIFRSTSSQTNVSDNTVQPATTYYYRVRSSDGGGYSPYSNIASAITPANTTTPWAYADIGTVGISGSNSASGNTITISGSGADIWDTADGCYFVWKTWTGDGVVEAQVTAMNNTSGWAKAGVMIRETPNAGARNVFAALTPTWHGIVAQARSATNDITTQALGPAVNAPFWVRVARSGNTFTASSSPDGTTWTTIATFTIAMNSTAYFGFAVTSHDNTQLNTATFSDPFVGSP